MRNMPCELCAIPAPRAEEITRKSHATKGCIMWAFSNFARCDLAYEGRLYPTLEHAYQAAKTFDPTQQAYIRDAQTPGQAKRRGRAALLRPDWEKIKQEVMLDLLRTKFALPSQCAQLLATGDTELIEWTTWHDTYWGKCTCSTHKSKGQNNLGKLLMQVRTEIRALESIASDKSS